MLAAAEEFTDPVGYSSSWLWLAILALVLVLAWYFGVALWSRSPVRGEPQQRVSVSTARERALRELDRIGQQVASGGLVERTGYQQMSLVLRQFVAEVTGLPAMSMALADLQAAGVRPVAETIRLMYPPEFAPSPAPQHEPLDHTLARAREVVATWS